MYDKPCYGASVLAINKAHLEASHVISYLIFFRKLRKMSQNMSSAAVVICAKRVKRPFCSAERD